ncbi:hypothetical protein LINGRAPRIM_LOCUS593 [Linum grandiflorum]
MALVLSSAQFVSISYKALLVGLRLWFPVNNPFGYCFAMKTSPRCASSAVCLAMVITIAPTLQYCLITRKSVVNGCWRNQKGIKLRLLISRRRQFPSKNGNLKSQSLLFFVLMSKYRKEKGQVQWN